MQDGFLMMRQIDVTKRTFNVEHNGGFQQPEKCEILDPSRCCDWLHLHSDLIGGKNANVQSKSYLQVLRYGRS